MCVSDEVNHEDSIEERIEPAQKEQRSRKNTDKNTPKTYVVTGAQYDGKLNKDFFEGLEKYCEENNGELLIVPMRGKNKEEDLLDPKLLEQKVIDGDYSLNRKLAIQDFNIRPNQIDPLTGLSRFVQADKTAIIAAPKVRLQVVPNSKMKLPKVLMTTGAVTLPNYIDRTDPSDLKYDHRINHIAERDHTYGAIVVEVENSQKYHFRHLTSLKNGVFYDLCEKYDGKKEPVMERPPAMVLGDWHSGDTNEKVREETYHMLERYNPKAVFLHDIFNGHSINHWNKGKLVDMYRNKHRMSLSEEIELVANDLEQFVEHAPDTKFYVVYSNHDDRLFRYLNEGEFARETHALNLEDSLELALKCLKDKNPLEEGVAKYMKNMKNIKFLGKNDDFKKLGWQLANHGHLGAHGARASRRSIENANGKSITMHSHVPLIFRNVYVGGTSTNIDLEYNDGYSGWMNTHVFLYDNGKPQLVNIIDGKHRRDTY